MKKESLFENPVWQALQSKHRSLALFTGDACRYQAEVAPFAAVSEPTTAALQQLRSLLEPGETVWLMGERYPEIPGLTRIDQLPCLQMELPETVKPAVPGNGIERLAAHHAPEMVSLTTLAFPGFFRARTHEMGEYYGVRSAAELIAMGGERLKFEGYSEISGVCTHPAHRGQGFASKLIWRIVQDHRRDGVVSWLHVSESNQRAIELYRHLGFVVTGRVIANQIMRGA